MMIAQLAQLLRSFLIKNVKNSIQTFPSLHPQLQNQTHTYNTQPPPTIEIFNPHFGVRKLKRGIFRTE